MKYKILKGSHSSNPFTPKAWVKKIEGTFQFSEQSYYDLGYPDQADWNKLCGISFNPLKPNQNAIMIGWRYNSNTKTFEVTPYINMAFEILNCDNIQAWYPINCNTDEWFDYVIDYRSIQIKSRSESKWNRFYVPPMMKRTYFTSFRIQPWFGGNRTAPNNIEINLNFS